jgi:hypothetical protein
MRPFCYRDRRWIAVFPDGDARPMAMFASSPRLRADLRALLVLALAIGAGACDQLSEGSVTLVVDQTAVTLDPLLDGRVTRLGLYDDDTGAGLGDSALNLGGRTRLSALAPGVRNLRLEALSGTSQVLAAARAFDVQLTEGSSRDITLHLRKPLTYVGGGADIQVTDTSLQVTDTTTGNSTNDRLDSIPLSGIKAMAATRGGELLVAAMEDAGGTNLVWIDTATHVERGRAPLGAPVRSILVHPHDRYIALLQTLNDAVLLIGVDDLLDGTNLEGAFRPVQVARPQAVAFDENDNLWIISSTPAGCDNPSINPGQLLHLDLNGNQLSAPVPLPNAAGDIGLNPVNHNPLVALSCIGRIVELRDGAFFQIAAVKGLGDVVLDGTTLYAVGWDSPTAPDYLPGVISVLDLQKEGQGAIRDVQFQIQSIPLTTGEQDAHGNYKYLYVSAVSLAPRAVTVTSHGGRVAFLHTITYSLTTDLAGRCNSLVISLVEQGLTLVDVETGTIVWTRPTGYDNQCACDETAIGTCITNLDADLDGPAYTPTALTLLTGGK